MTRIVLITRPVADAVDTAVEAQNLGFQPICAPVLEIKDTETPLPSPAGYAGLIFSSVNGVRSFLGRGADAAYFTIPVFAVGEHTANLARDAGFEIVHQGIGGMRDLCRIIESEMEPTDRLLHFRGQDVREDPADLLPNPINGITLYQARPVVHLDPAVIKGLRGGAIDAVLFYSARSAESFVEAVQRDWPAADLKATRALCLADSVVESVHRMNWADIRVSPTPDQVGMVALLKDLKTMSTTFLPQNNNDENAMNDAEQIIERFGGIRPMATKMNVPVTTVQGWKKRNVIPGNRRNDVINAARAHNVDLMGIVANQNQGQDKIADFTANMRQATQEFSTNPGATRIHEQALADARRTESMESGFVTREVMMSEIKKSQTQSIRRSVVASAALLSVFVIISGLLIAVGREKMNRNAERIDAIESTMAETQATPENSASDKMMTDLGEKFEALRTKTEEIQASVGELKKQAESFVGPADATLSTRLMTLEQKIQDLTGGNTDLSLVLSRMQEMQSSIEGQDKLQATMTDLQGLVSKMQGRMDTMDTALVDEQKTDSALGQTLQGVSPEQLKAAAMLIGLSQFRESMNRSGPFADDLVLLQTMLGEKDPALNAEIERLAPYAEKGVLSPVGLSNELKGLAGDIVVASISGQDVSIQDKALARFQDVLKIQKDGQPVMGSDAQARVARAQSMLDAGDVDGAVAELQSLQGPALNKAQPFIDQAQITAMAQKVQDMLTETVMSQVRMGVGHGGGGSAPLTVRPVPSFMGPSIMPPMLTTPPSVTQP